MDFLIKRKGWKLSVNWDCWKKIKRYKRDTEHLMSTWQKLYALTVHCSFWSILHVLWQYPWCTGAEKTYFDSILHTTPSQIYEWKHDVIINYYAAPCVTSFWPSFSCSQVLWQVWRHQDVCSQTVLMKMMSKTQKFFLFSQAIFAVDQNLCSYPQQLLINYRTLPIFNFYG